MERTIGDRMTPTEDRRDDDDPCVRATKGSGLAVELATYDANGRRIDLRAEVVALSRTAVRVRTAVELTVGAGCLVHFLDARQRVRPAYALGRIVEASAEPAGDDAQVAVQFEMPLDEVDRID